METGPEKTLRKETGCGGEAKFRPEASHVQSLPCVCWPSRTVLLAPPWTASTVTVLGLISKVRKLRLQEVGSLYPSQGQRFTTKIHIQACLIALVTPPRDTAHCWLHCSCHSLSQPLEARLAPHFVRGVGLTLRWNLKGLRFLPR